MPDGYVMYLGSFLASGILWRGDLFQDDGGYWARHTFTLPDGDSHERVGRLECTSKEGAVMEALSSAFECCDRYGLDIASMVCIHQVPGMQRAARNVIEGARAPQLLQ